MRRFLMNLGLAIVWMGLTGSVTEWNFLAGLIVGALIISVYSGAAGEISYLGRGWRLLSSLGQFIRMIVQSNMRVAWEVLTPKMHQKPRIIRYPVEGLSDAHRTAIASAVTLTPGTLVVDVSPDNKWLYIHCLYAEDREQAIQGIDEVIKVVEEGLFA